MSENKSKPNSPISSYRPSGDKRNDAGGAPRPTYTIPCPPKKTKK